MAPRQLMLAAVCIATAIALQHHSSRLPRTKTRRVDVGRASDASVCAAAPPRRVDVVSAAPPSRRRDAVAVATSAWLASAAPAAAASDAVPSAIAAYVHYLGLIVVVGALVTERVLLKPDMDDDAFDLLAAADIAYGVAGTLILASGYFRVTQYGKGWEFYAHEPIFWVKMTLFAVVGAASFFPTIKIIQHAVAKKNAEDVGETIPPPSAPLVARMASIVNAELLAVASIPLTAALMARGVAYADWLPWQAGAFPVVAALGGFGYKYVSEALAWEDEPSQA